MGHRGAGSGLKSELQLELPLRRWLGEQPELQPDALLERIVASAHEAYRAKVPAGAEASFRQYERYVVLQILDAHWREHLAALDHLRQGIHLRGYAQKNPKQEYKREAFELFGAMIEAVKLEVTKTLAAVQIRTQEDIKPDVESHVENVRQVHPSALGGVEAEPDYAGNGDVAIAEAVKKKPVARRTESRAQRSVSLRLREEVQALPRQALLSGGELAAPSGEALLAIPGIERRGDGRIKKPGARTCLSCGSPPAVRWRACSRRTGLRSPVVLCRENIRNEVRALVVNTGNANAGTGRRA